MGTKSSPSKFDCYAAAKPDEPMFVLLARDPSAALLVALWARIREKMGEDPAKIEEARICAGEMEKWFLAHVDESKMKKRVATCELWSRFEFEK